jgi:hypothetical protein
VILEICSQLCEDIAARSSAESARFTSSVDGFSLMSKDKHLSDKQTKFQSVIMSKPSSVQSSDYNAARSDFISDVGGTACLRIPFKQVCSKCDYRDNSSKLPMCYSVNGISLEDLQAFETQLMEVQDVKTAKSLLRSSFCPISKTSVLGSRSANAADEKQMTTNARLSLSCGSKMMMRENSASMKIATEGENCHIDSSQFTCDADAIRLTKAI